MRIDGSYGESCGSAPKARKLWWKAEALFVLENDDGGGGGGGEP